MTFGQDDPHTLAVAALCDVSSSSAPLAAGTPLCDSLSSSALKLRLHLYPSDVTSFLSLGDINSTNQQLQGGTGYLYGLARILAIRSTDSTSTLLKSPQPMSKEPAVCTVQVVFVN